MIIITTIVIVMIRIVGKSFEILFMLASKYIESSLSDYVFVRSNLQSNPSNVVVKKPHSFRQIR